MRKQDFFTVVKDEECKNKGRKMRACSNQPDHFQAASHAISVNKVKLFTTREKEGKFISITPFMQEIQSAYKVQSKRVNILAEING